MTSAMGYRGSHLPTHRAKRHQRARTSRWLQRQRSLQRRLVARGRIAGTKPPEVLT